MHLIPFSTHKERERERERATSLCEMKMLKKKRSKLLEQDQAGSDKDDDQDQLQREAYQAKWLNYKHIGLVSSPNSSSKQDYQDLGRRVVRSTGRKDRHSKICTAKGPRDRRVRLAANTAIQFYDLQDRLGYDRPSEAIEWLMKEAKLAIDDLQALPHETEQKTEHQTEFKFSNDKEDPFMGFLVQSDLHYLLHSTSSAKPRSQNQTFGYNHPVQPSLLSGSTSLNSEATFSNWSLPQTLELRNVESFFDVSGSAPQWVQAVPGGTLQSSYSRAMFGNLDYGNIPTLGPCLGTNNFSASDGFSGFHNLPESQGEDEKQNPYPNKPSSGSFLLNFQD